MDGQINGTGTDKIKFLVEQLTAQPSWKIKFKKTNSGDLKLDFGGLVLYLGSDGKWYLTC